MKSVMTHPTQQRVLDAIQIVAAWLCEIDAVEALVAPTGGVAFHGEHQADRLLDGWQEAETKLAEALKQMAALQEVYVQVYTERDALREVTNQAISNLRGIVALNDDSHIDEICRVTADLLGAALAYDEAVKGESHAD